VSEHVPQGVERVASWHLDGGSSREFATLGGDLNPLHWLPGYARLFGFEGILAHGFALLARAFEGLVDHRCDGDVERLALLDVRFPNALPLPASVGLFADEQRVFVGTAVGAPACLAGRYEGTAD
jgi:acyl dehydratase